MAPGSFDKAALTVTGYGAFVAGLATAAFLAPFEGADYLILVVVSLCVLGLVGGIVRAAVDSAVAEARRQPVNTTRENA